MSSAEHDACRARGSRRWRQRSRAGAPGWSSTKFDGDERIGDLADIELRLLPECGSRSSASSTSSGRPMHRQQIGLLEEIEELVGRPFRIGEALVAGLGRRPPASSFSPVMPLGRCAAAGRDRRGRGRPAARRRGLGSLTASTSRTSPSVLTMSAISSDGPVVGLALFARLHIGGQRLAAVLRPCGPGSWRTPRRRPNRPSPVQPELLEVALSFIVTASPRGIVRNAFYRRFMQGVVHTDHSTSRSPPRSGAGAAIGPPIHPLPSPCFGHIAGLARIPGQAVEFTPISLFAPNGRGVA